jgi:hypothetical protein
MGLSYATLGIRHQKDVDYLICSVNEKADRGKEEKEQSITKINLAVLYLRVTVTKGALCSFSYSLDGRQFQQAGAPFKATPGRWIGAKLGIYCTRNTQINDSGFADFDWFRVTLVN